MDAASPETASKPPCFVALKDRALLSVDGLDSCDFLQGLLTQDLASLAQGELRYAALLTPQGRLLLDLFILGTATGVLLDVAADRRDDLIRRLTLYRLRAKVTFSVDDRSVVALLGDCADMSGWLPDPRLADMGWRGYGLEQPQGAIYGSPNDYQIHRTALGIPDMADFGEDATYPIEANLDLLNAIDFRKGCFVGQETTSRMKRRGQIKSRMLPISGLEGPLETGAEVLKGELRAGEVRSTHGIAGLALMRLDRLDGALSVDGRPVEVRYPDWIPRTA